MVEHHDEYHAMKATIPQNRRMFLIGYRIIRRKITTGEYETNALLPERVLARELGISPSLLRDAFARLAQEGLVRKVPHKGWQVCGYSDGTDVQINKVFVWLHELAIREAVASLTPESANQLRQAAESDDFPAMVQALCLMTGNHHLLTLMEETLMFMVPEANQTASLTVPIARLQQERAILLAVADGDSTQALNHMRQSVVV